MTPAPAEFVPTPADTLRARVMFVLAFVFLLLTAGFIHRATSKSAADFELIVMYGGLLTLWPIFVFEVVWGVVHRDRSKPRGPVIWRAVLVCLMPPWRMALTNPRTGLVWIPRLGWRQPGKELFKRLELAFSGPMLVFALLVLPVLILEYVQSNELKVNPIFSLCLDVAIAVIWVAFATEFVFKGSVHPKPWRFVTRHWIDAAIVILPMLEFLLTKWAEAAPLARLLRVVRAASPEQLARLQQLYRLRGVATKGWHALLLFQAVARLLGQTHEKRLAKIQEKIEELEDELADLRKDAETIQALISEQNGATAATVQNQPEVVAGGGTGEPSGEVVIESNRPSQP